MLTLTGKGRVDMVRKVNLPTVMDFDRARVAVRTYLKPTPLLQKSPTVWFKLESQQPIGAFKLRGAIAALSRLPAGARVITASAGNHALGVAWAADLLKINATIVVAETASSRKKALLRDMGANVVEIGSRFEDAEAYALEQAEQGAIYISAYNDPHVIAGQGTIVDELLQQMDGDFTIVTPIGGGGLAAGIARRASMVKDRQVSVIGVEAEASQAVSVSMSQGQTVDVEIGDTIADGLAGNLEPGSVTVDILRDLDITTLTVNETEIAEGIRRLYYRHDLTAEGAGAVAYAGFRKRPIDGPVVVLITGRNIAEDTLHAVLKGANR